MTANLTLNKLGLSTAKVVNRILSTYSKASEDEILEGKAWYPSAFALAEELAEAGDMTVEQAGVMIAHLSPRLRWTKNVVAARALVATGKAPGVFGKQTAKAIEAMTAVDPWVTFGKGPKTIAFAQNILGNEQAVTVDVWAARVAGITEQELSRVGVYEAVAHAYRLAAKRVGITPAQMQAITWVAIRNQA